MTKKQHSKFPGFAQCMSLLRNHRDAEAQEEGYAWLHPRVNEYVDELLHELTQESDPRTQSWLFELLRSTHSVRTFPLYAHFLVSLNPSLRYEAQSGLRRLRSFKEGHQMMWEAYLYGLHLPPLASLEEGKQIQEKLGELLHTSG